MAQKYGPRVTTDGLVLCLDAADNNSAPNDDLPIKKGLLGWWDAADDTTITTSGSNVTQWRDKSGNNYHMSPNGTGPTRNYTQNSRSVLTFTAAQDIRDNTTALNLTSTTHTIVVVSRYTTGNLRYTNQSGRILQGVHNNWLLGAWDSQPSKYFAGGWVSSSSQVSTNDTTWGVHIATGNPSTDTWEYRKNGTRLTVGVAGGSQGPNRLSINSGAINEKSPCEVAELIVFDSVLSNTEILRINQYLSNKWDIPVTESTWPRWFDRVSTSNYGTFTNSPVYKKLNKGAIQFDGSNDFVAVGDLGAFSTFTVEVLFKSDSVVNYKNVLDCNWLTDSANASNSGPRLEQYTNGNIIWVVGPGDPSVTVGAGINLGTITSSDWVHSVITKTGPDSFVGYKNLPGTNASQTATYASWYGSFDDVVIGKGFNTSRFFDGKIALVRIYNRALTQAEVLQNYNAIKGRFEGLGTYYRPAESAAQILEAYPNSPNGTYWIKPAGYGGSAQEIYCDMAAGGWMLVASNNASDTTIPGGTSRNSSSYFLNRNGTNGALGTPHPDSDYIIGNMIDSLSFSSVRIFGWGRNSIDGTYSWTGDDRISDTIVATWNLSSSGSSRRTEVVALANVTLTGTTTLHGSALYFVLDAVACDSGLNANANQTTVGGAGVASSSGDPSGGTYLGHGSSEGSYEGWYISGSSHGNSQGYTTWVK